MTPLRIFIICFVFYVAFLLVALSGCREQTCPVREVEKVDHSLFDTIVRSCVNTEGLVDYGLLRSQYGGMLREYLDYLGGIDADKWSDEDEDDGERSESAIYKDRATWLAFWINAYNALCLQQVLDLNRDRAAGQFYKTAYPQDSLFFHRRDYFIAGRRRTLNEIQNLIIRPGFSEPRVFAALCSASRSGAPLRPEAYRAERLPAQLDNQCRLWIASKPHNRLDTGAGVLYLSAIFKNFAQDFDRLYDNPQGFFLKYTTDPAETKYLQSHEVFVSYLPFDWSLNG